MVDVLRRSVVYFFVLMNRLSETRKGIPRESRPLTGGRITNGEIPIGSWMLDEVDTVRLVFAGLLRTVPWGRVGLSVGR